MKVFGFFFVINIFIIVIGVSVASCLKDSKYDYDADSIKIAKIFQPDGISGKDAIIEKISPTANYGGVPHFTVFSWTNGGFFNTSRALIEFDLSLIPQQTIIKKAELSLYWTIYENLIEHTGENSFTIYRITEEWDEGSVNWNNQPEISEVNKIAVPKSKAPRQSYINIDVTALVQDIINNPTEGHGFLLKLDEEFPYRLVVFGSSDNPEIGKRPKLVVYY